MAHAICQECVTIYHWRNKKGRKLSDYRCPFCGGLGRAAKRLEVENEHPLNKSFSDIYAMRGES